MRNTATLVLTLLLVFPPCLAGAEDIGLLRRQAESGVATAQVRLGLLYQNGWAGLGKDPVEAGKWFARASDLGDADGEFLLGYCLQGGHGMATDTARATVLLGKAASRGHPVALEVLALQLIPSNPVQAVAFLDLAGDRMEGSDLARSQALYAERDRLGSRLNPDDLQKARVLAQELAAKTPVWTSQLFTHLFPEGEPAFTDAEAEAVVKELTPLVERAAWRRFRRPPAVRCVGRAEAAAALERDLLPQYRNLMPQAAPAEISRLAAAEAIGAAPFLLGKFGFADRTLFLLPRNVRPLMQAAGIPEAMAPAVVRILIAHELTHALHDQYLGLQKTIGAMRQQEHLTAFNAAIEGHASFVADAVAAALGLDREAVEFARLLSAGVVEGRDPGQDLVRRIRETQYQQIYQGGRRFIEFQFRRLGRERLWEVLEKPPTRTSMIARPETWSPEAAPRPDYSPVLAGLERRFGRRGWMVQNVEIGLMQAQAAYAGMDPARREAVLASIRHIQGLIVQTPGAAEGNGVTLFVLDGPAAAAPLLAAQEEMARRNLAVLDQSPDAEVTGFTAANFAGIEADRARLVSYEVGPPGGPSRRVRFWRIARGPVVVEIGDVDAGLGDAQVAGIAEEVFRRYQARFGQGAPAAGPGRAPGEAPTPPR